MFLCLYFLSLELRSAQSSLRLVTRPRACECAAMDLVLRMDMSNLFTFEGGTPEVESHCYPCCIQKASELVAVTWV